MKKILALVLSVMILIAAVPGLSITAFAQSLESVTAALAPRGDVGLGTNYPGGTNVLVVAPYEDTDGDIWDDTSETVGDYMAGLLSGNCTKLLGEAATNEAILAEINKGTYAVILIDSHGNTGGFRTWSNGSLSGWFSASTLNSIVQAGTKPLNNALVYSTSCYFMENSSLSDAFIAAGAGFVCGDEEESYAMPEMKRIFTWCLTGFYDGDVYTAEEAFDKAIATSRASFAWDGNGSWELRENPNLDSIPGGSGSCGTNVSYSMHQENGKKLLYIYPTSNEEDLDYSMVDYLNTDDAPWAGSGITHVTIEKGVKSIADFAFYNCTSLTLVTIPDSVTSIGDLAFYDCTSLTSITIPDRVTSIGKCAFQGCGSLTSVTIPDSVTSIGDHAFYDCTSLTSVTIGNSVTSIGLGAFYRCTRLTSATIPDSVTSIGIRVFTECSALTEINVDSKNQHYSSVDGVLFNKEKTELIKHPEGKTSTSYTIPDSVTSIGDTAFQYCTRLTSVKIPDSVTSIEGYAFSLCSSLTSITIPGSVTSIEDAAFIESGFNSVIIKSGPIISCDDFGDCMDLNYLFYEGNGLEFAENGSYVTEYYNDYNAPATYYILNGGTMDYEAFMEDEYSVAPTKEGYVFTGWYSDESLTNAIDGVDLSGGQADIEGDFYETPPPALFAGWEKLPDAVSKDADDQKGIDSYNAFDTCGVQIRTADTNKGLRFVTSFNESLLAEIEGLYGEDVSYGYAVIAKDRYEDTSKPLTVDTPNALDVECSGDGEDHRNFTDYRLFTLVVTYDSVEAGNSQLNDLIVARPYIRYTDLNGNERYYYGTYTGTSKVGGGCCTNYNRAKAYYESVLKA